MAEGNDMNRKVPLTLENADAYLPADVYESGLYFEVNYRIIRFGLESVKNVGSAAVDAIVAARV